MVTLYIDDVLEEVSWEDLLSRPNFVPRFNPAGKNLKEIIGIYRLEKLSPCGLTHCGVRHFDGYVVTTSDGMETNIGNVCGKSYFDVDFKLLSNNFKSKVTDEKHRRSLSIFSQDLDSLKEKIINLKEQAKGGAWLQKQRNALERVNSGCPPTVINAVRSLKQERKSILTISRLATNEEFLLAESLQGKKIQKPYYINEELGRINGIEALYPENDIRKILVFDLENKLNEFVSVDIFKLSSSDLSAWVDWTISCERLLILSEKIIGYGRELFVFNNLKVFMKIIKNDEERFIFDEYLKKLKDQK